jgi:NAD(P)H dehydrogenase (quinone)
MKILVLFYSAFGHIYQMAKSAGEGVCDVKDAQSVLKRVPETLPEHFLEQSGIARAQKSFSHVPVLGLSEIRDMSTYDAIIFGTPAKFGGMCAQMKSFLESAMNLWQKNAFIGKVGSVFVSSATQHGGQESAILGFHATLLHLGFIIVGLPYTFQGQNRIDEITGGSPYGAATIAGSDGQRMPSANELHAAWFQGRYVATIASKLTKGNDRVSIYQPESLKSLSS